MNLYSRRVRRMRKMAEDGEEEEGRRGERSKQGRVWGWAERAGVNKQEEGRRW